MLSAALNGLVPYPISNQSFMAFMANKSDAADVTGSAPPTAHEVRQLIERILCSRHFSNAPKKQKFLQLICEAYLDGRASELNEYLIGYEVFDRNETYDPALDSIVRVGAHEVRKKLELYYKSEGINDEILLEIPAGSYIPIFTRLRQAPESPESSKAAPSTRLLSRYIDRLGRIVRIENTWVIFLVMASVLLIIAVAMLTISNRQLRRQIKEVVQAKEFAAVYKPVWEPFLNDGNPTMLVLSNPPVYRFWNPADHKSLSNISINLTPAETAALEETLGRERFVLKHNPLPRLVLSYDEYTGIGEAVGLYRLATLFKGFGKDATLKQSRTVSAEDMKNHNVILLGSVWVNEWSGKDLIKEDFGSGPSATIVNYNPLPGEEREYSAKFDEETGRLIEDYGLITIKPNISEKNTVMVLAGTHSEGTEAAAEYLTSEERLASLNQRLLLLNRPAPKHFQVLLKVKVDNGIPTIISIVTIHELHSDRR
ncbi:MAG TPA: hypothetical protein VJ810_10995 [Blastocatellia bacterium]|nr:hypothetical protein [Blastocatellia bacterium]